jgi:4-hydroxy 2-oxovalerate aldolase
MTLQRDVRITDTTLRDGSHAMSHKFTERQVRDVVRALSDAGVPVIEVAHGDGLGGSSFNYGFSAVDEIDLIAAAAEEAGGAARIASLLVPGVGRVSDLEPAAAAGTSIVRVATHCTEADVSRQHFAAARELGLETVGFLMLSHMIEPVELAVQARIMADAGCQCVYVVDSAGALVPDAVDVRVRALVEELGDDAQVGFHAHNNLGCGIANSIAAYRAGAVQIDGSTRGLGAGAGNAATELLATVFDRLGVITGIDPIAAVNAAEEVVARFIPRTPIPDRDSIMLGYAGAYSSFLLHAHRAGERYGIPAHEILLEVGRRRFVGGQEDMIIGVALDLAGDRAGAAA